MSTFGLISYGTAGLGFLLLLAMLVTSWKGRAAGRRLIVAVAATATWAGILAWQAVHPDLPLLLVYTVEILRDGAWIAVILGLGRPLVPRVLAIGSRGLWFLLLAAAWALAALRGADLIRAGLDELFVPSGIAMALAVLVLLEQVYRNAAPSDRAALRYLVIGLGGVFAYDLFLYSQAALFDGIAEDAWFARGLVTAMMVPLIAIAARRNPQWSLDVFVSRQAVMFTTSVIAIGMYLLLMALGGYFLQAFGDRWGTAANLVFFVGAAVVLAVVVMTGFAHRRLRVFVSKHFFRNKYDYRVEWLRFVETLSGAGGVAVRRTSVQAIAQIFESPGGVLYVHDASGRQFLPAAAWPMGLEDLPGLEPVDDGHPMVRLMTERQWILDLRELARERRAPRRVEIPGWLMGLAQVRLISPLLQGAEMRGFVMLYDPPPPFEPTFEDRDLLRTVGRHVATLIAQQEADFRLAEARQFEAYHRLTAFLMHDLKNAVAQLQLVVGNAIRHKGNPEFIADMVTTVGNASERMNRLIEQLRDSARAPAEATVDLVSVAHAVIGRCTDRQPAPVIADAPETPLPVRADSARLSSVLEHVIRNAQDASTPADSIRLTIEARDGQATIVVADSGAGMTAEFVRERLFRPFDSTKGAKGMGVGAYQVREYVQGIGGSVQVQSQRGRGTRFEIRLPVLTTPAGEA
ncbi:MAG: XrtA/PEP-CTERM system histidine kinase PrsK [Gammaproteobacteria bacterium]